MEKIDWDMTEAFITDRLAEMLRERGNSQCWDDKSFNIAKIYVPQIMQHLKKVFNKVDENNESS